MSPDLDARIDRRRGITLAAAAACAIASDLGADAKRKKKWITCPPELGGDRCRKGEVCCAPGPAGQHLCCSADYPVCCSALEWCCPAGAACCGPDPSGEPGCCGADFPVCCDAWAGCCAPGYLCCPAGSASQCALTLDACGAPAPDAEARFMPRRASI